VLFQEFGFPLSLVSNLKKKLVFPSLEEKKTKIT
jgi:hypothetical protein